MMLLDKSLKQEVKENPGNEAPINIYRDYVGKKLGLKKLQAKVWFKLQKGQPKTTRWVFHESPEAARPVLYVVYLWAVLNKIMEIRSTEATRELY